MRALLLMCSLAYYTARRACPMVGQKGRGLNSRPITIHPSLCRAGRAFANPLSYTNTRLQYYNSYRTYLFLSVSLTPDANHLNRSFVYPTIGQLKATTIILTPFFSLNSRHISPLRLSFYLSSFLLFPPPSFSLSFYLIKKIYP